jgi:hypothetical protein
LWLGVLFRLPARSNYVPEELNSDHSTIEF